MESTYKKYLTMVALTWTGCFVVFFILYMLLMAPQLRTKKQTQALFTKEQQTYNLAIKAAQEDTKSKLNKQLTELKVALREFVVDFGNSASLIFDIRQIANERRVEALSIKTKNGRTASRIPNCDYICQDSIDISFDAEFNQFAVFLNELERHQPVIFVNKFDITRAKDGQLKHKVNMGMSFFVGKAVSGSS